MAIAPLLPPNGRLRAERLRLPELNLIPVKVLDPRKAAVVFVPSPSVDLYSLLFQSLEEHPGRPLGS